MALAEQPGSDVLSRLLMEKEQVKRIVLRFLGINYDYTPASGLLKDKTMTDVLLLPFLTAISDTAPPVIVKFQQQITEEFMTRVITYGGQVKRKYKLVAPFIVVSNINSISLPIEQTFSLENNYYTCPSLYVARKIFIFNIKTILAEIQSNELSDVGALAYFCAMKENRRVALKFKDHPVVTELFSLAEEISGVRDERKEITLYNVQEMIKDFENIGRITRSVEIRNIARAGTAKGRIALEAIGGESSELTDREFAENIRFVVFKVL